MKSKPPRLAEEHRITYGPLASSDGFGNNGAFELPFQGVHLLVVVSDQDGWDHVSVSLEHRCPTWDEMDFVRRLFFRGDEWVMQLHAPPAENINNHPYCLHMWRSQSESIPTPPRYMVGIG
jgi:hypothetical protein